MKKIWDSKPPNKNDIIEFITPNNRITGYYEGFDEEENAYVVKEAIHTKRNKYYVRKENVDYAKVIARRSSLKVYKWQPFYAR